LKKDAMVKIYEIMMLNQNLQGIEEYLRHFLVLDAFTPCYDNETAS
jgi:hypothetical protein